MRTIDELVRDLKFLAKYEKKREYNEINVGAVLTEAAERLTDLNFRYHECAADAIELDQLLCQLKRYIPRECSTCGHWIDSDDEVPKTCAVGGCASLTKRENWEWSGNVDGRTLFAKIAASPEAMAEFLVDRVVLQPCVLICGDECTAIGNLRQTRRDQCKEKILAFLNQEVCEADE